MPSVKLMVICALLSCCTACDWQSRPVPQPKPPYQRFIAAPREPSNLEDVPWVGSLALDTKTGQLCKTYEWSWRTNPWASIPRCLDLYKNFPD